MVMLSVLLADLNLGPLGRLPWWLVVPLLVYWAVVIVLLVYDNREPSSTLIWLFVLIFLPLIGLVLFLFFGRDWKVITARRHWAEGYVAAVKAKMRPVYERNAATQERFAERYGGTFAADISATIRRENGSYPLPADSVEIFATGAEKFDHLERDLAAAASFIHMEYFIWEQDELTARVTQILLDRLAAGVEVRILYDYIGSISFKKDELHKLAAAGAQVSADVKYLFKLNYRNHRKIVVIDGVIGYTGGMNLGQEYIDGGKRFPSWRDTHLRITGQTVAELEKLFAMRWFEDEHDDLLEDRHLPPAEAGELDGQVLTQVVAHTIEDPWEASRRAHMIAISQAERSLNIQSPYFVPDPGIYDAMINAALSGVNLRFMMTGLIDKKLPFWAAQTYYEPLLRAGAHIYLYEAGFFHAKTIAVDSMVCAVGTMNMDIRSLRLHKELMVWIFDQALTRQLEAIFERDLLHCREITLKDVQSVGRWQRFRNSFARLFSAEI
jgi:cardiolipin synthase